MIEIQTKKEFEKKINKQKKVLALFYTSWCPFCRKFLPIFKENSKNKSFDVIVCVNMDDYSNPLWEEYSIDNVPTVIFFNNGKIKDRLDGKSGLGLTKAQFASLLSKC